MRFGLAQEAMILLFLWIKVAKVPVKRTCGESKQSPLSYFLTEEHGFLPNSVKVNAMLQQLITVVKSRLVGLLEKLPVLLSALL